MVEEIDENDFFQQDFTTASEWEIFNAKLEEIFHEWKLHFADIKTNTKSNELLFCDWEINTKAIFFANVKLSVKFYKAKVTESAEKEIEQPRKNQNTTEKVKKTQTHLDLMELGNDFCIIDIRKSDQIHPLAMWFGLREFVVIEPVKHSIMNESQCRTLLSSACICAVESCTEVPTFIRIMQQDLNVYFGVGISPGMRINFDVIALETTPSTCKYLTGLLCMFKEKIGLTYIKPVTVSICMTYAVSDFSNNFHIKGNIPFSINSDEEDEVKEQFVKTFTPNLNFQALPYGVSMDPVNELILNCIWPEVAENVIVDSATYSDLNPMLAPVWSIRVDFKLQLIYYLTDTTSEYLKLLENSRSFASIVNNNYELGHTQNAYGENSLDLLKQSKISSFTSTLSVWKESSNEKKLLQINKSEGPIKDKELMQMLYYMFPDAEKDSTHPYKCFENSNLDSSQIKTGGLNSLVHRVGMLLATCNSYFGGIQGVGQLWSEFTQEMRYRVENCIQIPGVAPGFPDSKTCLFHQKLQMLNICMERCRIREGGLPFSMTQQQQTNSITGSKNESEDDEFYDCVDDEDSNSNENTAPWNKPVGRLSKLSTLTLIESNEPLYVPITQESIPKTEDQLEDDAEVMLKLGSGSELFTQMMSASLLSDMESFKAANPNGKFEDFIRWYSPKDWIEEIDKNDITKGSLSQRMLIPGNTWQRVWNSAKPVPARRQKRLFDDKKEAEKILNYFETRTVGQICQLTIVPLFHSVLLKLEDELKKSIISDVFNEHMERIRTNLCKLSYEKWLLSNTITQMRLITPFKKWECLLNEIATVEQKHFKAQSLAYKLFDDFDKSDLLISEANKKLILLIVEGNEAIIQGAARNNISLRILNIFANANKLENQSHEGKQTQIYLPNPIRKEYVLRVDGTTTENEIGGPQFLRAILNENMRLCGAFSEKTSFFK